MKEKMKKEKKKIVVTVREISTLISNKATENVSTVDCHTNGAVNCSWCNGC